MKIKFAIEAEMEITQGNGLIEGKEREFIEDFAQAMVEETNDNMKDNHYPIRVFYIGCDYNISGDIPLLACNLTPEDC